MPDQPTLEASAQVAIYHCTPMTPRAALNAIGPGRNFCVSFWRPDDAEAVERIASTVMFRQWRIFRVATGDEARAGMVRAGRLVAILPLAGTALARQPLGDHSRCTWRTVPAQRRAAERLAIPTRAIRAGVAHGWPGIAAAAAVRPLPARLHGLDRDGGRQGGRLHGMVRADVRDCAENRRPMAADTPFARRAGRARVSLCQRGRKQRRAERVAI